MPDLVLSFLASLPLPILVYDNKQNMNRVFKKVILTTGTQTTASAFLARYSLLETCTYILLNCEIRTLDRVGGGRFYSQTTDRHIHGL